jgi:hypothetical protein
MNSSAPPSLATRAIRTHEYTVPPHSGSAKRQKGPGQAPSYAAPTPHTSRPGPTFPTLLIRRASRKWMKKKKKKKKKKRRLEAGSVSGGPGPGRAKGPGPPPVFRHKKYKYHTIRTKYNKFFHILLFIYFPISSVTTSYYYIVACCCCCCCCWHKISSSQSASKQSAAGWRCGSDT